MHARIDSSRSSVVGQLALAPTIAALPVDLRSGLELLRQHGFRSVQISATQDGSRPRELDQSARRDLLATLRRRELTLGGIDAWVPVEHLVDPARADRATAALLETIALAGGLDRVPISLNLPDDDRGGGARAALIEAAAHAGVSLVDHVLDASLEPPHVLCGIDPAAWLAGDRDPVAAAVAAGERIGSARLVDLLRTGMRGPVGDRHDGRLDVLGYRVALEVGGYRRPVVLDCRQWSDPLGGLARSADAWKEQA